MTLFQKFLSWFNPTPTSRRPAPAAFNPENYLAVSRTPPAPARKKRRHGNTKYPVVDLRVGQSRVFACGKNTQAQNIARCAYAAGKRHNMKFSSKSGGGNVVVTRLA